MQDKAEFWSWLSRFRPSSREAVARECLPQEDRFDVQEVAPDERYHHGLNPFHGLVADDVTSERFPVEDVEPDAIPDHGLQPETEE